MKRNPIHSFPGALAVGVLLAAVALTCAVMAGAAGVGFSPAGLSGGQQHD